jgi:hypothetical protein
MIRINCLRSAFPHSPPGGQPGRKVPRLQSMQMRRFLISIAGTLAAAALAPSCLAQGPGPDTAASAAETAPEVAAGLLYVFNDSGPTLIPSNQVVTDNGTKLASLPRRTYVKVRLTPGLHLLKPDPPLWKQQVLLNVVAGNRYFVVVAYKPERSWAAPLAGTPLVLHEITEEQAAPLLADMKPQ